MRTLFSVYNVVGSKLVVGIDYEVSRTGFSREARLLAVLHIVLFLSFMVLII